jgi:hypothetical protein
VAEPVPIYALAGDLDESPTRPQKASQAEA